MGKFSIPVDDSMLLKAYRIQSLEPSEWEDIDHDAVDSLAGGMMNAGSTSVDSTGDPLGLGAVVDIATLSIEQKAAILLSSKSFDPKVFLSVVHPNANYQDLASGGANLQHALESRSEAIRILVEENFDRYVAVKSSTDVIYSEMREGLLSESADFGSAALRAKLKLATGKADQVFLPVLENASKADKLRSTVTVFERSKFFFNLPGSLREAIENRRYEAALRDYKKGKFLLESKPGQLLPLPTASNAASSQSSNSAAMTDHQKRIFDKVWAAVENVMEDMRATLLAQLKESTRSVEEQERIIEILMELDTSDESVWTYLDSQHQHILSSLRDANHRLLERVKVALDTQNSVVNNADITQDIKDCLVSLGGKDVERAISEARGWRVWKAIWNLQKGLSEIMVASLPGFWKIAKAHINNKFRKDASSASTSRRSPAHCRNMALDIVKLYISLVSEFFHISEPGTRPSQKNAPPAKFVPIGSNSISAGYYLTKILSEIAECAHDIGVVEISSEASFELNNLLSGARWRFEDVLCELWLRDGSLLRRLEDWTTNKAIPNTTEYLTVIHKFQKQNTTGAYKISTATHSSVDGRAGPRPPISPEFNGKITKTFFDALYSILDGFASLAMDDVPTSDNPTEPKAEDVEGTVQAKPKDADAKILLIISNIAHLKKTLVPNMISQLEAAFNTSVTQDRNMVIRVLTDLDKGLFADFVAPKTEMLTSILRAGITDPSVNWLEMTRPTEVRQYMFNMLLRLVEVHAKVSSVSKALVDRTMAALVMEVVAECLRCFKQVSRFGMGGMLRATLEMEFMHQTLLQYVTPQTAVLVTELYTAISDSYDRRPTASGNPQQDLQVQLDGVKKTLSESRKATQINFVCFKKDRTRSAGERDRDRSQTPSASSASGRRDRDMDGSGSQRRRP